MRGDDVDNVVATVAPFEVRGTFALDVAMLDALDLADTPSWLMKPDLITVDFPTTG